MIHGDTTKPDTQERDTTSVRIDLDPEVNEKLERISAADRRSKRAQITAIVERAVREWPDSPMD